MRRFPLRTLLLMLLALAAFFRLWCVTHQTDPAPPAGAEKRRPSRFEISVITDGGIRADAGATPDAGPIDAGSP